MSIVKAAQHLLSLFYPNNCMVCGAHLQESNQFLCVQCKYQLPKTNYHQQKNNPVEKIFWGRVPIENATAYIRYTKKSNYSWLLYALKYKGFDDIGDLLGYYMGLDLVVNEAYKTIDYIVPVPLHPRREKTRGYNQSLHIAQGLAKSLTAKVEIHNLIRKKYTYTQTKKNKQHRLANMQDAFEVKKPYRLEGKHILLVDDVVTTGATLEACALELVKIPQTKVSIATLAHAV